MPCPPAAAVGAAASCLLAGLAALWAWLTFFRRYRVHRIVYGSPEVEREFRDVTALSWPIPPRVLTRKQFSTSFNDLPAPRLSYQRHTFPCAIWPELGEVAYDEVFLPGSEPAERPGVRPLHGEKGIFVLVCPLTCNTHVRCMRRTMHRVLSAGYRCYALVTRGNGGHLLDPERQKVYLDEGWNLQDMFEFVDHLAGALGSLPPMHFCGHSLGGMRVAHFAAQVAKLLRKQAEEARGVEPTVRHDGDNRVRHTWRGFDNEGTRRVARLLGRSLGSCCILYPHYDPTQPFLSLARIPRKIDWAMRPLLRQNEAAMRVYLTEALSEARMAGRDPSSVDKEAFARYVAAEVDRTIQEAMTRLETGPDFDTAFSAPLARQESVTDYYTSQVVTGEELREIAGLTRLSPAKVLYYGAADDTLTSDVFPHDYAAQGIEGRVLAVQMNRGEHVGTVLSDGSDVMSYFVLRVAEAKC